MTERERFLETVLFGKPDRIPFQPGGPRESTLAAWRRQGLPEGVNWHDFLLETLGIERHTKVDRAQPSLNFRMIPEFEEKILQRRERTLIVQDWKGNICEISDRYDTRYLRDAIDFVTRRWIKCPVATREDWEQMKTRYRVGSPARFGDDFEIRCARIHQRDHVFTIGFPGPFWQLREWCGFEGLCMLFLDDPEFVRVHVSEDMAFKEKAMISPAMCREFLLPCWRQWCDRLRGAGVPVVDMDSDGYVGELIPLWIEAGLNVCDPVEVAAGNDILALRREFGRSIAYRQGVDKRAIAKGGKAMRAEMDRIEPVVRDGGYIPGCDHGVPSDVSWPVFVEYARVLGRLTGWL
jgi:hypothetical protein